MGKTFGGVNSKSQEGRERKIAQKEMKKRGEEQKKEERENEQWAVGAKAKSTRQAQEEERRHEKLEKKKERERLEAEEAAELAKYKPLKPLPKEKGRERERERDMQREKDMQRERGGREREEGSSMSRSGTTSSPSVTGLDDDQQPIYSASNIDDALFLLDSTASLPKAGSVERHPERRAKAAFAAYEAREMPRLKIEYPGLRLSQLRERLQRMWTKAPENPFNQTYIHYNATKSQELVRASGEVEETLARLKLSPS